MLRHPFPHFVLFQVDAASPRLGRAFRTAPVSRQTKPNRVWHSPRFHSRPATLLRPPFCPFHQYRLFFFPLAPVEEKKKRYPQKREKQKNRRKETPN